MIRLENHLGHESPVQTILCQSNKVMAPSSHGWALLRNFTGDPKHFIDTGPECHSWRRLLALIFSLTIHLSDLVGIEWWTVVGLSPPPPPPHTHTPSYILTKMISCNLVFLISHKRNSLKNNVSLILFMNKMLSSHHLDKETDCWLNVDLKTKWSQATIWTRKPFVGCWPHNKMISSHHLDKETVCWLLTS